MKTSIHQRRTIEIKRDPPSTFSELSRVFYQFGIPPQSLTAPRIAGSASATSNGSPPTLSQRKFQYPFSGHAPSASLNVLQFVVDRRVEADLIGRRAATSPPRPRSRSSIEQPLI